MIQKYETPFLEKAYAWLLLLIPVLSQYRYGTLDLDVVLMVVFFLVYLLRKPRLYITPIGKQVFLLLLYMVGITVANIFFGRLFSTTSDIIVRAGKYGLYLLIVFFMGNELLTYKSLMRIYRYIAFAATIYIIIQAVAYYGAGITLPHMIGGSSHAAETDVGRLRSFYSEPAAMAYAMTPFVICSLFGEEYHDGRFGKLFDALFVSIGVVISTSGQGIVAIGVAWTMWLILRMIRGEIKKAKELLLIISLLLAIALLYQSGILKFALGRVENTSEGSALDARMSGYETLSLLGDFQRIFGAGYGNYVVENIYGLNVFFDVVNYSSIAQFLFTLGIAGTLAWALFFVTAFLKGATCSRVLITIMLMMSFGGCPMLVTFFPIWLTLICLQLPPGLFSHRSLVESKQNGKGLSR